MKHLWEIFEHVSNGCSGLDVFDIHLERSIKQDERNRRNEREAVEVTISHVFQPLPANMATFWLSTSSKVQL